MLLSAHTWVTWLHIYWKETHLQECNLRGWKIGKQNQVQLQWTSITPLRSCRLYFYVKFYCSRSQCSLKGLWRVGMQMLISERMFTPSASSPSPPPPVQTASILQQQKMSTKFMCKFSWRGCGTFPVSNSLTRTFLSLSSSYQNLQTECLFGLWLVTIPLNIWTVSSSLLVKFVINGQN